MVYELNVAKELAMDIDPSASRKHPLTTQNSSDKFIQDNGLDLSKTDDVITFLRYEMAKIANHQKHPYSVTLDTFQKNCLEYNLKKRQTAYELDDSNNVKILLAVSGAGKTRTLLELLYQQVGYYFVVSQTQEGFGSSDLGECKVCCATNPEFHRAFVFCQSICL